MNRYLVLSVGLLLVTACSTDPVSVVEQFQEAVNSQNVEAASELLAEDAVLQVGGTLSRTGKTEIESWLAAQADLRNRIEGDPASSDSGVSIESCSISSDMWLFFDTNPMSGTCDVVIEGGLITSFTVQFDENSKASLSDSPAAVLTDLAGIWTGQGAEPDDPTKYVNYYLQFFDDGSARWAASPDDLSTAPDSDHIGAFLSWTYKDFVLTVQNQGSASEGYCRAQDVGTYFVKRTDDGGIQFKVLGDSCAFRNTDLTRYGSAWDRFEP